MGDLVGSMVSAVAGYLVDPIARQFKYLFLLSNNVNAVTDAMKDLSAKRESTMQDIQIAELEGKTCSPEVALWFQKVDAFDQDEVDDIKKAFEQRTNCIAIPSLNVVSNYKLGSRAFKKKKEIVQLLDKAVKFDVVAKRLPPGPVKEQATPSMILDEKSNLDTICQYLKENMTGIIGIWGMGGVGKTTLLKSINNEFYRSKDGMFNHVIFVVVSQQCSYGKIRSDIAKNLGLPSTNEDADANAINDYLKKKSFLLLLDDLWSELDLEKIGVPQPKLMHHDQDKHKRMVVFTTRSENVCGGMEANKMIKMECLVPDAAWSLFKAKAGEELIASDNLIQQHAKDIVRECAGLPLALVTVGKAMRTKKTAQEWDYVASMMRKSKYPSIPGMRKESDFFPILKVSYDNLESDTLKQCFLYCSLWREDATIPTDDLIECWMGHGLLDDFVDIDEAYNKGGIIIGNLMESCLLESDDSPWARNLYKSSVKLHDVIRDLALRIASDCGKTWLVHSGSSLLKLHKDVISREVVINFSLNTIRGWDGFLNRHKLETLIMNIPVYWGGHLIYTAEFFTKIRWLKYLDLSGNIITTLPEEIGGLIGLEYLKLRMDLISVPMALSDLKNLKYLYVGSSYKLEFPNGLIASLTKLQVLDLYWTNFFLEGGYVDELLSLIELKGVMIRINNISTLERLHCVPKKMIRLESLNDESDFTSISISPSQLGSNSKTNLHTFHIAGMRSLQELVITTEGDSSWCLSHLHELILDDLPQLNDVIWKDLEACNFLPCLASLRIMGCHSLTSLYWTAHLPHLEALYVTYCDKLKSIVNIFSDHTSVIEEANLFKSLKSLDLDHNPALECIYEGELSLPSIELISFFGCDNLRKLPLGLNSAKNLEKLMVDSDMWDKMDWAHKDHFSHLVCQ
ncbi:P-loop containing nucleoside triphosphate hydrolase protein [Dioscorea alata]|uniref:P-loop containing nucleoside triphosphate hydrolase protein n=1 Tax=Dioscorea alata TaxID=55571 RepID=A0ACB7VK98_DIOAL|nr:P-loop containing nucleoside triphosphate hydrolase protein [Dioscorea alata]